MHLWADTCCKAPYLATTFWGNQKDKSTSSELKHCFHLSCPWRCFLPPAATGPGRGQPWFHPARPRCCNQGGQWAPPGLCSASGSPAEPRKRRWGAQQQHCIDPNRRAEGSSCCKQRAPRVWARGNMLARTPGTQLHAPIAATAARYCGLILAGALALQERNKKEREQT